jgi:hypothetical protein
MASLTNPTAVNPPTFGMSASEVQTIDVDMSDDLGPGDSVAAATGAMTDVSSTNSIALTHPLTIVGNVIWQTFDGLNDQLQIGAAYRYRITYTTAITGDTFVRDVKVLVSE